MPRLSSLPRLIALAALAALGSTAAQAQANITLFGLIDMSVGQSQAPGAKSTKGVDSGNMTTSFWGVKGAEDLGGGMSAVFALESFLRADVAASGRFGADTFWARNAYVGLTSGAGTVTLGRNTTSLFVNTLIFNAFGDSFGFSPAIRQTFTSGNNFQVSGDTGWSDSVKYTSPNFSGLSMTAHAALGEGNGGRNFGLSALYFGGPFGAGFAWQKAEKGSTTPDTTAWQLGASFNMAPVKFYAQYGTSDNKSVDNTTKVIGLGGDWTIGNGKVMLQWGKLSPDVGADRKTLSVGYDYLMSKRTDLYAVYMHDKLDGLSAGKSYAVGVRHRFCSAPAGRLPGPHPRRPPRQRGGRCHWAARRAGARAAVDPAQAPPGRPAGASPPWSVNGGRRGLHQQHNQARSAWNTATPPPPDTPA